MKKFICTDRDNLQYGRKININNYEFKEFKRHNYRNIYKYLLTLLPSEIKIRYFYKEEYWIRKTINLQNYTSEQMKNYYECYGFPEGYLTNWIIAECIFEQESGLY